MGNAVKTCGFMVTLSALLAFQASAATLTHRYSFEADASDSVGGANGTLLGAAYITNGMVLLNGSNSYVRLPNDLLSNYSSVSLEVWYSDAGSNTTNSQVFNFTGTNGSLCHALEGRVRCASNTVVKEVAYLPSPAVGGTNHLIWTLDGNATTSALYLNGILVAQTAGFTLAPAGIRSMTNNYVGGCGSVNTVSNFSGGILEFRIYQDALTPLDAALLDAFGPDQSQSNPGALQALRVVVPAPVGPGELFRAGVDADFINITNVNISTQPDLVLISDNTNVIAVMPDQRLLTLALGTANITAVWQGMSNSLAVTVALPQDIALVHRYGFNEQTNDWVVHDSVGKAHGRMFNTGSYSPTNAVFTGQGEMNLSGGYSNAAKPIGGYAALPPGMISGLSEVTIEAWVTWKTPPSLSLTYGYGAWQRIFDFGSLSGSQGVSYLNLIPASDNNSYSRASVLFSSVTTNGNTKESPRLMWTNALPTNVLSHVAVAYSPPRKTMKVYLNGKPVLSGAATLPLAGIVDTNCWLGKSQFSSDAYFYGRYNEFRLYRGLLADADIAADYAAGPEQIGVDYVLHTFPSSNSMAITWGPSATNLVLKTSPTLDVGTVWTPVLATPTLVNGRYSVSLPTTNSTAFYRLTLP